MWACRLRKLKTLLNRSPDFVDPYTFAFLRVVTWFMSREGLPVWGVLNYWIKP